MIFPDIITIRDKYGPAMAITDQQEADAYFEACVEHGQRLGKRPRAEAEKVERANLGYFAGYCDDETRRRVERLFRCAHPVFGSIEANGPPSPDAALAAGLALGMRAREGR